ncbi:MAG: hypothetical protein IKJ45_12170 [Kiritimatiellae bacterium]|nr:hypothetical protein [Kiritimatiellia bacterium]
MKQWRGSGELHGRVAAIAESFSITWNPFEAGGLGCQGRSEASTCVAGPPSAGSRQVAMARTATWPRS